MDGQANNKQLTFTGHLNELRRRLFWPAFVFIVTGTLGYSFHETIISFLKRPINETLYFTAPAGNFNFIIKVCFIIGFTFAIPMLIYGIISFIEPAFQKVLRKTLIVKITILSLLLAVGGAAFAYYLVIPVSLRFFLGFKISGVSALISVDDYLNFILTAILSFIIMFQLPLLMLFINRITPLKPSKLLKYERHVIVASFVIALLLPFTYDPLTQFMFAVPIILLYNIAVILVWITNRKPPKKSLPDRNPTKPARSFVGSPTKKAALQPAKTLPLPKPPQPSQNKPVRPPKPILGPIPRPQLQHQAQFTRRTVLDVTGNATHRRSFLDLRPSAQANLNRVQ